MRYRVYGYTDSDPAKEQLLYEANTLKQAIHYAKNHPMATAVVDNETDDELWSYP
jgi:hypothetical protein